MYPSCRPILAALSRMMHSLPTLPCRTVHLPGLVSLFST